MKKEREIKVIIPDGENDDIDFITVSVYFKEKANCRKFTDMEGITYITGYAQEGKRQNDNQDDLSQDDQ